MRDDGYVYFHVGRYCFRYDVKGDYVDGVERVKWLAQFVRMLRHRGYGQANVLTELRALPDWEEVAMSDWEEVTG